MTSVTTRQKGEADMNDGLLDQSLALNSLTKDILRMKDKDNKRLFIALIVSILINVAIVGSFLWYELQFDYVATTTTEVTQDTGLGGGENHSDISIR